LAAATIVVACGSSSKLAGPQINTVISAIGQNTATVHLTTKTPVNLLVAFVSSDAPEKGKETSTLSSDGGLRWQLRGRKNHQLGDVEVWTAKPSTKIVTNLTVSATLAEQGPFNDTVTVVAFSNAHDVGRVAGFDAPFGSTAGSIVTSHDNTWIFGVVNDWTNSIPRTAAPDQVLVSQFLDDVGDTYASQRGRDMVPKSGTFIVSSDTAPTTDPWNYLVVEVY
jgi:hypothetical protein